MPNTVLNDIPILVVDDAKFSSAIIAKVLRGGGFNNVRFTNNPLEALRSLEKRGAHIVIADWLMPALDGLELTKRIKRSDDSGGHFTYVMLMTAREEDEALQEAFDKGVDDFINKAQLRNQLLSRVTAAARISQRLNELIKANKLLQRKVKEFHTTDLIDPVTGLGNQRFTIDRLDSLLRHVDARKGAACLLLIGINNLDAVKSQYSPASLDELMSGIGVKIRNLVRPLDVITRPEKNLFAVITWQDSLNTCTSRSFSRIFDALYMQSFKTEEGYVPIVVGVSITAADQSTGLPGAKDFMRLAYDGLTRSFDTGTIFVNTFDPNGSGKH